MKDDRYSARRHLWLGFSALAVLLGFLGGWAALARISGAVIATGVMEVATGRQVVEHDEGGIVAEIRVRDGDLVVAGDPLIRLDDRALRSEYQILQTQYFDRLALAARLRAETEERNEVEWPDALIAERFASNRFSAALENQRRLFETRHRNLTSEALELSQQGLQLDDQLAGIAAHSAALIRQRHLIGEELDDTRTLLDKGLARAPQLKALEREKARIDGEIGHLKAEAARIETRKSELIIGQIRLFSLRREEVLSELRAVEPQIIELRARLISLQTRLERQTIRAPVGGVIFGSQVVAEHSVISAAEPILYIVPNDQPLVISARIDAVYIDEIRSGQEASLRFSTFDQRFAPELTGIVKDISADVIQDEQTGLRFYEVKLDLADGELEKLGEHALIPGLPVEAFIQTEERTPLHYLTKPLTDYFTRAWKES